MKTILFQNSVIERIDEYIDNYEEYFFQLFTDTGIFNEATIQENYVREAKARRDDIFNRIVHRLSPDIVMWRFPENTIFIPWRSKVLFLRWEDIWERRIITDLKIH